MNVDSMFVNFCVDYLSPNLQPFHFPNFQSLQLVKEKIQWINLILKLKCTNTHTERERERDDDEQQASKKSRIGFFPLPPHVKFPTLMNIIIWRLVWLFKGVFGHLHS